MTRTQLILHYARDRQWSDVAVMVGLVILDAFLRLLLVVGPILRFLALVWFGERCS